MELVLLSGLCYGINLCIVSRKKPKSAYGAIDCFALLFSLLSLHLFITHKNVICLVVLHLWLPSSWMASVFRPFDAKCGVPYFSCYAILSSLWSMGVITLIMSGLFAMDLWNLSSLNMGQYPLPWPAHKNIRPFPSHLILDEAVTLTFSCCEVSASRILQVPEPYSLNFFKNFSCCRFPENFSCLTVK